MTKKQLAELLKVDLKKKINPETALEYIRSLTPGKEPISKKNLEQIIKHPPKEDVVLHKIYETAFVIGEIVIAGKETRKAHPLTEFFPIHFRKTYKGTSRWETNPAQETLISQYVWEYFSEVTTPDSDNPPAQCPRPLGCDHKTYRSQLIEAKSLGSLSPIQIRGDDSPKTIACQILQAREHYGGVSWLWNGLEALNKAVDLFHQGGFLHKDLHRENMMLSQRNGKWRAALIDFETTIEEAISDTLEWKEACLADKSLFLEEACLIRLCRSPSDILPTTSPLALACNDLEKRNPKLRSIKCALSELSKKQPNPEIQQP